MYKLLNHRLGTNRPAKGSAIWEHAHALRAISSAPRSIPNASDSLKIDRKSISENQLSARADEAQRSLNLVWVQGLIG